VQTFSFDIHLLGLRDASQVGRKRFLHAMARLTGRGEEDFQRFLTRPTEALFRALDRDKTQVVVGVLEEAGVRLEIRPSTSPPIGSEMQTVATQTCPRCAFVNPADITDCQRCGLVFAKWERESVQRMQRDSRLEEALTKALVVREEWNQRAKSYLEKHPLPEDGAAPFASALLRDEVPFLRLNSDEGPLLMTSRRLLVLRDGAIGVIPYELVSDVDFGGGIVQRKAKVRMVLTFHSPLPGPEGPQKKLEWSLDKESGFAREVVMDWVFARNFMCGSCGARELQHRLEGSNLRFRCMRCATDHDVDLTEAVCMPILVE
jgi:hypothetical protein